MYYSCHSRYLSVCEYNIKYYLLDFNLVLNEVKKCQTVQNNNIQNSNKKMNTSEDLPLISVSDFPSIFQELNHNLFKSHEITHIQISDENKLDVPQKVSKKLAMMKHP